MNSCLATAAASAKLLPPEEKRDGFFAECLSETVEEEQTKPETAIPYVPAADESEAKQCAETPKYEVLTIAERNK